MRTVSKIEIRESDSATLKRWARGGSTPFRLVKRAEIVLQAADGIRNKDIAKKLGTDRQTVARWRRRYAKSGLTGIAKDAPGRGRPAVRRNALTKLVVERTLQTQPANATQWSVRTLAGELKVSPSMVYRIWRAHELKPHQTRTFKLSKDPHFIEKLTDIVGLYLNPPEHAMVLCADEKSQIQALDRTQPGLPLKKGRCGTMTHDYKRNGTTTLFAAMDLLEGRVLGICMPRHRHQEWLKFLRLIDKQTPKALDLHLIIDNYGSHKHPKVKRWMRRHPRFHQHFIPTSSSWLNLIERWFRELTTKRIRRGTFQNTGALISAIMDYIDKNNQAPVPFVWTATAETILAKIRRAHTVLDKVL